MMNTFIISYDLREEDQDYDALYKAIEELGDACRCLKSLWIITANLSLKQVVDKLALVIDENDGLFVIQVPNNAIADWIGLDSDSSNWLKQNISHLLR